MTLDAELAGRSVCRLETIGRTSGQPRDIEMWFAADPRRDRIYLLSGGRERAHWVRNIRHDPTVRVRISGRWFNGEASEIEGGPDEMLAREALATKYQGWRSGAQLSGWARTSLPVAIDLRPSEPGSSPG